MHFAGLAMELNEVRSDGTAATENRARLLQSENRLSEHPESVEVTRLYAACSNRRRWVGEHYLTGPKAGVVSGPLIRWGAIGPQEKETHQVLIRAAVGIEALQF